VGYDSQVKFGALEKISFWNYLQTASRNW
jgi:hypothetical protein